MKNIMDSFPMRTPRVKQVNVLNAIDRIYEGGSKVILLESPVGSGKSAIAMTVAKHYGDSHIITTQKALQGQYFSDFRGQLVTMKGRNAYPCMHPSFSNGVPPLISLQNIKEGNCEYTGRYTCDGGPCMNVVDANEYQRILSACTNVDPCVCPYKLAMDTAKSSKVVIHNTHSFFYQAKAGSFQERNSIIVDECHDLETTIRDVGSINVSIHHIVDANFNYDDLKLVDYIQMFSDYRRDNFRIDDSNVRPGYEEDDLELSAFIQDLSSRFRDGNYIVSVQQNRNGYANFKFTELNVGGSIRRSILDLGEKALLMSGTIFNKDFFCAYNGLDKDEVTFIRSTSEFPVTQRPVIYSKSLGVNCQKDSWYKEDRLGKILSSITTILNRHPFEKGLIHVGSYDEARLIHESLRSLNRVVIHDSDNFEETLNAFYRSEIPNLVLVSPRCQQGVDVKDDRARFQIITKVPYLNVGDKVINRLKEKSRLWYNMRTLIVFGQQLGRIVRSPSDWGTTYLLDSRFPNFLRGMWQYIPEWQRDAIRFI